MTDTDPSHDLTDEVAAHREPSADVGALFVNRWLPRAMTGEPIPESEYRPLFEAARWAPSSRNSQPWRFAYAARGDEEWETFVDLLNEFNRSWAADAAVLALLCSETTDEKGRSLSSHSLDAGAAWENLALEGARRGLVVHPMGGFDHEAAANDLDVPETYDVEAMIAIGERAPATELPADLRDQEFPKGRKPLDEIVSRGGF
ncbi:nitroreductase [Halarchaeum rubridurum]|uniref:Nitroreductase n=1 Tax=Halarchaeum rubridurum TaxID=489911 RepID=A0A830FQX6_9EURY|nr:nitroreductase family protein [Halarchaeum rubridurum]MBP1954599.1 nitroreductase [Halarchaeum rubridurum]GGM62371.1 nitroreductase [Halarchaeum rubridurum]